MTSDTLNEEVERFLASLTSSDTNGEEEPSSPTSQPLKEYDIYIEEDRITIIPKTAGEADNPTIIESDPTPTPQAPIAEKPLREQGMSNKLARLCVTIAIFFLLAIFLLQLQIALHPPTATIYIIPKTRSLTLSSRVQLGSVLRSITMSQEATTNATGHGYQPPAKATGFITFYNGANIAQTIHAGTVLTGQDGILVATSESVTIPPNNLPVDGEATVPAHALSNGATGNIVAEDIDLAVTSDVTAKNPAAFTGGRDVRYYTYVKQEDITTTAATLKPTLQASMQGALGGELKSGDTLQILPCSPTVTASHAPGEEATQVTVTVSLACSAVAYNQKTLQADVSQLQTSQAVRKIGVGYTLLSVQVKVTHATPTTPVVLSFSSTGTWVYGLTAKEQQHIKSLIAGLSKREALRLLTALPGVESANVSGVDQNTPLPHDPRNIHLVVIFTA